MAKGRGWVRTDSLRSFAGVETSLHLTVTPALFYSRFLHDVLPDYSAGGKSAARGGNRVRSLGGDGRRAKEDLREWKDREKAAESLLRSKHSGLSTPTQRSWAGAERAGLTRGRASKEKGDQWSLGYTREEGTPL